MPSDLTLIREALVASGATEALAALARIEAEREWRRKNDRRRPLPPLPESKG